MEDDSTGSDGRSGDPGGDESVAAPPVDEGVLQRAIEENPEEVARLIERLGLVNELLDATEVVTSAMNDRMVKELSGTSATLVSAADAAATDQVIVLGESVGENGEDLAAAMETLAEMQRDGTLDELQELTDVLSLAGDALDDEMVRRLAGLGAQLGGVADAAADERTVRGVERMLTAVGEADAAEHERVGAIGMIRALRDHEVQMGLGYVIAVARAMGQDLSAERELADAIAADEAARARAHTNGHGAESGSGAPGAPEREPAMER